MREFIPYSFSGQLLDVGLPREAGMLHRTKYSRFRNESLTSLEEDTSSDLLRLKGSSASPSTTPNIPTEDVTVGTSDSSISLCTLVPRMANVKLANPSTLPSLKNFCLRTKEVSRLKLTECVTVPTRPALPEIRLSSCLSTAYSQGDPDKAFRSNTNIQENCILLGLDESAFLSKPSKDLGQKGESSLDTGISYAARYMGCIEVLQSMRSLDFGTRTQVTREAISRLCEAVPGIHGNTKKRKPPAKFLSPVLGKSNLQFSGTHIKLTISTTSLTLLNTDSQQIIANHHMQSISFASGGDPDTTDYVAYVAKDPVNQRACHILECPCGIAQEVINTIGQAFELRFKQYLKVPSALITSKEREGVSLGGSTWNIQDKEDCGYYNEIPGKEPPMGGLSDARLKIVPEERLNRPIHWEQQQCLDDDPNSKQLYENCPDEHRAVDISKPAQAADKDALLLKSSSKVDLFDDPRYINTQNLQATSESLETVEQEVFSKMAGLGCIMDTKPRLWNEECYHGKLSRKAAESLLMNNGDFLVRESTTSPGQYVLSGLQGGQVKHLLLVDPEGKVRTKDHIFDSVDHLIRYHMENKLPIISSGSELRLCQPVRKGLGQLRSNE
ncbi:SHC-transforming protein 4 isoform X1 [Python bivittatus]|uniref:SHC-transforming protein 4 isoform X1 n=1 Tax=Python bivittatus TaxID=176946 RepID=A0A9F2QW69_PYTBI|nr:SHC-transforming protein 4 isoform X1 [Python bivittatus]